MVMVIAVLVVLGLCFGSFVNALVWRLHEQAETSKHPLKHAAEQKLRNLSVLRGRSMCPECRHELSAKDLIPLVSWLWLRGKCRYCKATISWQYPTVEAVTMLLFVGSYVFWPQAFQGSEWLSFGLWLAILVGLVALTVYDVRWMVLPNRIVFPLLVVGAARALVLIVQNSHPWHELLSIVIAVLIGGGIFYALFQLSAGRWIGGGDVKLGLLLGLVVAQPSHAFLLLFLASVLGTLFILPPWLAKKVKKTTRIPFGPFLIAACIVTLWWGANIINWYQQTFLITTVR